MLEKPQNIVRYKSVRKQRGGFNQNYTGMARVAIAFAQIDNLSEVFMDQAEEAKPQVLNGIERALTEWVVALDGYLRQVGEGKYMIFLSDVAFQEAEKNRFSILDKVREIYAGQALPLSLSMGVGIREDSINELGRLAQNALDLALERGGDQVVVKSPEKTYFYGGRSTTMEKRTKVKARVIALALKDLIRESRQVVIMGHEMADYDSLGAALGLAKAARDLGKKAWVVVDRSNASVDRLREVLPPTGWEDRLVRAGEMGRKITEQTLLIIVDTHKPTLLADKTIKEKAYKTAIIDHHRRGEDTVPGADLLYIESYASSTSELVTEMLQYLGDQVELTRTEATALLAGITVDTKRFTFQTGVRTFEAASYLRRLGGDPSAVQKLLRENFLTALKKARAISNARVLYGQVAYCVSQDSSPEAQVLAATTADGMLNIAGINASFVLWPFQGGVAVSARSNGEINVQAIMERLGGGGHFTVAAAQLNVSLAEAEEQVLNIMEEVFLEEAVT